MSDHTPTPWKLAGIPDNMIVCDSEGGSIADCAEPGPWVTKKIAEANAAFIVKAVNSHDALVKALDFLLKTTWKSVDKDNMEFEGRVTCYQLEQAHAALALVGEGKVT